MHIRVFLNEKRANKSTFYLLTYYNYNNMSCLKYRRNYVHNIL